MGEDIMDRPINIQIKKSTHQRLTDLGSKGDTFDDIIVRLLDAYSEKSE